ncbi:hypothetical protein I4U23_022714 [Adineta vaga]|nr:hypothetical protein I4U23_022714 [Adineta vaga]
MPVNILCQCPRAPIFAFGRSSIQSGNNKGSNDVLATTNSQSTAAISDTDEKAALQEALKRNPMWMTSLLRIKQVKLGSLPP